MIAADQGLFLFPTPAFDPPFGGNRIFYPARLPIKGYCLSLKYGPVIPGSGATREPGIHEHRPLRSLEVLVFVDSGFRPADGPGMTEGFPDVKLRHYPSAP